VGIGISSPNAGLEVANAEQSTFRITRNNNTGNYLELTGGTSGGTYNINTSGTQAHIFQTAGTERVRITSDGSVGIGTTSPSARLHISGASSNGLLVNGVGVVDLVLQAGNLSGGSGTVQLYAGNNNNSFFRINNEYIREGGGGGLGINVSREDITAKFQVKGSGATSSTTALLIQNANASASLSVLDNGYVGIGTGSASYNLDVNGTARVGASGGSGQLFIKGLAGTGQYLYLDDGSKVWSLVGGTDYSIQENGTTRLIIKEGGNVGIGTSNPPYKLTVAGDTYVFNANLHLNTGYGIVDAANISYKIGFPSLGNFAFENVNVGIGTTSPSFALHVSSSTSGVIGGFQSSGTAAIVQVTAVYENKFRAGVSSDNSEFWYDSGYATTYIDNNYFSTGGSGNQYGDIRFRRKLDGTNLSTVVTIRGNDGNVGINTTTPSAKLQVKGSGATSSTTAFRVENANASGSMVVLDDGNVGIGTTSPTARQSVLALAARPFDWGDTVARGALTFSGTSALVTALTGDLQLFTDNGVTTGITVKATSGNVGIGTTSPASRFQSNNTSTYNSSTPTGAILASNLAGGNAVIDIGVDATYLGYIQSRNILNTTAYNLLLNPIGGNVGIGTASPTAKLDVNGTFKVSNTSTFDSQATFNNANIVATGLNSQVGNFTITRANSNTSVEIVGGATSVKFDAGNGSASTMFLGKTSIAEAYITASAMLHVKSTGATSSTTALLVQNANLSASLSVKDDGTTAVLSSNENPFTVSHTNGNSKLAFVLGNGSAIAPGQTALRINDALNVLTFDTGRIQVALPMTVGQATGTFRISGGGGGSDVANPAIFLTDNTYNAGGYTVTSGTQTTVQIGGFGAASNSIWKPASGSANYTLLAVAPNMSGSGTYSGTIRGIYYAPTVDSTTYGAHRAIETTAGDVVFNGGNVGIGTGNPTYALEVSGSTGNQGVIRSRRLIAYGGTAGDPAITTTSTIAGLFEVGYAQLGFSSYAGEAGRIETNARLWNIGMTGGTAKFNIRGTGATSSTTALLVQNSNASASLVVLDDGNVGIGTTSPTEKLHILGDIKVQTTTAANSAGIATIKLNPEANTPVYIQAISNFGPTNPTAYSGGFKFVVANRNSSLPNPYYSIDALSILANGNIGIGTTTPSYTLDVSGSGNFTNNLTVTGSLNLTGALTASSAIISGDVIIQGTASVNTLIVNQTQLSTGSNQLGDAVNDTQTLYGSVIIPTGSFTVSGSSYFSGNVGIGTTSPGRKLNVYTDGGSGAATGYIRMTSAAAGAYASNTYLEGYHNDYGNGEAASIGLIQFETVRPGVANVGGNLKFYTKTLGGSLGDTPTVKMTITQDGNVGIGTASPTAKLQVKGSGATSSTTSLLVQNANASGSLVVLDDGSVGINVTPTSTFSTRGSVLMQALSTIYGWETILSSSQKAESPDLFIYPNHSYLGSVNIGPSIGSNLTDFMVRINGMPRLTNGITGDNGNAYGYNSTNSNAFKIYLNNSDNNSYGLDVIRTVAQDAYNASSVLRLVTRNTQNSGITRGSKDVGHLVFTAYDGTNYLDVAGIVASTTADFTTNSGNSNLRFGTTNNASTWTERMRIDTTGSVGIGTTTPAYKLDVAGDIRIASSSRMYFGGTGSGDYKSWINYDGTDNLQITHNQTNRDIDFNVDYGGTLVQPVSIVAYDTPGVHLKSLAALSNDSAILKIDNGGRIQGISGTGMVHSAGNTILFRGYQSGADYGYEFNLLGYNAGAYGGGYFTYSSRLPKESGVVTERLRLHTNGNFGFYNSNPQSTIDVNGNVQIKGTGATSSTTAFLVQNANASASLSVTDDNRTILSNVTAYDNDSTNGALVLTNPLTGGSVALGVTSDSALRIKTNSYGLAIISNSTSAQMWIAGDRLYAFNTASGLRLSNYFNNDFTGTLNNNSVYINDTIIVSSSLHSYNALRILNAVSSSVNGVARGLYISPSLSGSVDYRAIETTVGAAVFNGGRVSISGSAGTGSALYAYKSGSTVLDIQGSQGQLFSVIDTLSGSLMSVNDISGLPILEVFSDDRVVMGTYGSPALTITGSNAIFTGSVIIDGAFLDTVRTGSLPTGSTLLYTINTGSYQAGFFDYYVSSGSNFRAGTIMSVAGAGTYKFTDQATPDIGNTTNLQFSMSMANANLQLYASASSTGWTVKTTFRTI
jgi:hypothetical protein